MKEVLRRENNPGLRGRAMGVSLLGYTLLERLYAFICWSTFIMARRHDFLLVCSLSGHRGTDGVWTSVAL